MNLLSRARLKIDAFHSNFMKNVFLESRKKFSRFLSFRELTSTPIFQVYDKKVAFSRFSQVSRFFQVSGDPEKDVGPS